MVCSFLPFGYNLTRFEHFLVSLSVDICIIVKYKIMSNKKVWFITGASKGLGLALTKLALSEGDKVIAASRNVEVLKNAITGYDASFLPLKMDITSDQDVKNGVQQSIHKFGRIDVVVNNAGYS